MLSRFFYNLREAKIPVSLKEYLTLLEALKAGLAQFDVEQFYYLSRTALIKDERYLDKFDQVFGTSFKGLENLLGNDEEITAEIPEEWLRLLGERFLSEEEKTTIQALGGWDKLMETLKERLAEQKGRHQGGNKWIGTEGTSPFGANGYNPEGIRIGQDKSRHRRAVKVWDKREFRNFDDQVNLGTRNIQVALRRLRRWVRQGAATQLDLPDTINSTARNGGALDLRMVAERHNAVKVLLLLDVGGSMDDHIRTCEELFSAARGEFKHLEQFYFHNCPYEGLWKDNRRRQNVVDTWHVIHTYGADYKLIFVGDASMSPYELVQPGGSVEHFNPESGQTWMSRLTNAFPHSVWLNPVNQTYWHYTQSINMINQMMNKRMFPLTLAGLDSAMRELTR